MTTDQAGPAADAVPQPNPTVEKRFAVAEIATPLLTAAVMPLLDPQAATTVATFLAAPVLVAGANHVGLLSDAVLDQVPGGDILRAHRLPFLVSAITTVTAAATATLQGAGGIDSLVAGFTTMPSMAGVVSAAWWGANAFIAFTLRKVLASSKRRPVHAAPHPTHLAGPEQPTPVDDILRRWHTHISDESGAHPGQHLTLTGHSPDAWEGVIEAAPGRAVTVTPDTVSGVYRLPAAQIHITDGPHTSSKAITVHLVPPPADQTKHHDLQVKWAKRVARKGGTMPGTHLENVTDDPNTGGQAAWIVADDDTDAVNIPDMYQLSGALFSNPLLVSVEPGSNPRKAKLRIMEQSPLESGTPLPGDDTLTANANGFVRLGIGISGRPARVQLFDPKGGARHCLVAGVTGSGKGGVLQLIALSYHVNGVAIIYADPKGSSNPDVEDMAAYAGCGPEQAMGALRLAYAILRHRIAESQQLRAKNFTATPDRPYLAVILDEMAQLLGEKSPYMKEAAFIVAALAEQGRSMGMCLVLCGQIINLDKMGSDSAIRDNVFYGGALILLRSDSAQKDRVDLPGSFAGIDPSKIPAYWKADDEQLIYDPNVPEDDPSRTFGVGYVVGPDERAEMMRAWILESAAELYDPAAIVLPADFPDWAGRDLIAATPVGPAATDEHQDGGASTWVPGHAAPSMTKEPTAQEKILTVLDDYRDPIGLEVGYLHLDAIIQMTGIKPSTAENALSRLTKDGTIVRNADTKGEYGLPVPAAQ